MSEAIVLGMKKAQALCSLSAHGIRVSAFSHWHFHALQQQPPPPMRHGPCNAGSHRLKVKSNAPSKQFPSTEQQ
eukprot:1144255-Pelagomonas_calceolata.AAC.14